MLCQWADLERHELGLFELNRLAMSSIAAVTSVLTLFRVLGALLRVGGRIRWVS